MGSNLSIAAALARMEAKIAHHKAQHEHHAAQVAHHAAQLALHGEQEALHEAEHRKAIEVYESFKAASVSVGEMIVNIQPGAPHWLPEDIEIGKWRWLSKLMSRLIESKAPDEVFGPSTLIREIRERWGAKLRRPIDPRSVSTTLHRWAASGRINLVRNGRSYHESLYTRG